MCAAYSESVLQLPQEWQLKYYIGDVNPVYELWSDYQQSNIDILEEWIKSNDVEAFKAVLSLSGYL